MEIKEKIEYSADKQKFTLFKEGIFYKCYNEDAILFANVIKPYKIRPTFVKCVNTVVLSLGFPMSEVENGRIALREIAAKVGAISYKEEELGIVFTLKGEAKRNLHDKKTLFIQQQIQQVEEPTAIYQEPTLIQKIQEFDLANSTPMDGMIFIQTLKNMIKS